MRPRDLKGTDKTVFKDRFIYVENLRAFTNNKTGTNK